MSAAELERRAVGVLPPTVTGAMTTEQKRLENLKARAAMAGLELHPATDPAIGWSLSDWTASRFFSSLNEIDNYLNNRIGGQ